MNRLSKNFPPNLFDLVALPVALALTVTALILGFTRDHSPPSSPPSPETSDAAKSLVKIQDRAAAAGYGLISCQEGEGVECHDDIIVTSSEATLWINLDGRGEGGVTPPEGTDQRYGVFRLGRDHLQVNAIPTPERTRDYINAFLHSADEVEAVEQGRAAYAVIGNHLWSATSDTPYVIDEKRFLDVVGKLEGCAPDCRIEESSFDR
ncbi:MAG: hypothetical protein K0R88_763 [Solirubrobacterales bacterium]|jgi:hypothetical protein|nr:hypothetical protein [Solirubrobacterales bacterium]